MGMYDSLIIKHECPRCHGVIFDELQTKDGMKALVCLHEGDSASKIGLIIQEGMFNVYGDCNICHWWTDYYCIVRKGKITGVVPKGMHSQYNASNYINLE